jgi:hypothetical protein
MRKKKCRITAMVAPYTTLALVSVSSTSSIQFFSARIHSTRARKKTALGSSDRSMGYHRMIQILKVVEEAALQVVAVGGVAAGLE